MSIVTDEMVKKATAAGYAERKNGLHPDIRATLEAVVDDIIEACAEKAITSLINPPSVSWEDSALMEYLGGQIRSLKSNP
jgi:hypothetical protein